MLQDFRSADFGRLAELWNAFYPAKYAVTPAMIRLKSVESPVFDWGASMIQLDMEAHPVGMLIVKKSPAPTLYKGDPDCAHVSAIAYTDPIIGVDLLEKSKHLLRNRGISKLHFGADSAHFFPGGPSECQNIRDFLMIQGFEMGGDCVDVECDLGDYEPYAGCLDCLVGGTLVRAIEEADLPALEAFFDREFPGRWKYDVTNQIKVEGRPDLVDGLFVDGKIEGFSFTQDFNCKYPIGGAVWHVDLGEKWGALGPIGISAEVRGKGLGGAILGASLKRLRERGVRKTIIDWTGLVDFYGMHGFKVNRRYNYFTLSLESPK